MKYYPIDETTARAAKQANSFYGYKDSEATDSYKASVDEAYCVAERQKTQVDPMYHDKIDALLDTYARRLAENMNESSRIDAGCPSWLIAGSGNSGKFAHQKEKQNRMRDKNMEEWREINDLICIKLKGIGMGGISSDDPGAVSKLRREAERLEGLQEKMKAANAYYKKYCTLDGCPVLDPQTIHELKAGMSRARDFGQGQKPYESWDLSNNAAAILRKKARIEELLKKADTEYEGWLFPGGRVELNKDANSVQILFDSKPDGETRDKLKSSGFRWAPSQNSWQRMLNENGIYAAKKLFPQEA
jgi:hypothetical protein